MCQYPQKNAGSPRFGIALLKGIDPGSKSGKDNSMSAEDKVYTNVNDAKLFTYTLLKRWQLGKCNNSLIILYASDTYAVSN